MSDLHRLPLVGHDLPYKPQVRAWVFAQRGQDGCLDWYWMYRYTLFAVDASRHGPFTCWREAYDSARRMVEEL